MRQRAQRSEQGFTLIELLIVLVILPLVTGAIAMVLITTLKNQQGIQGKVTDSAAAATSSEFYTRDVASAGSVTTAATPASAPPNCPMVGATGTSKLLLGLQLQGTTPATDVAYYMVTAAQGPPVLVRDSCTNNNGTLSSLSHQILSDNLNASDPPTPVVNCISPTPTSIPTGVSCTPSALASDWVPSYMVSTVTLNVTQACTTPASSCAPYQFALTGDPQSGIPVPPIVQPCGVLNLLGTSTDITFAVAANQTVQASGPIVLDSGYSNNNTPAIGGFFTFGDNVNAGASSACPTIPASDSLQIYNCLNTAANGSSANFQPCPTSGSHDSVGSGISVSPAAVQTIATPTDPLAAWAQQNLVNSTTVPVGGTGNCTTVGSTMTCTAGTYSSGLNIPNNRTVNFAQGNYQFNNNSACGSSLCVGSSDTVNFGKGHYIYANGIEIGGSGSSLCGGNGTSSSCPNAPSGGVFFYIKAGNADFGNFSNGNVIDLGPLTGADPYAGKVLWEDGSDPNPLKLTTAGSAVTNTFGGGTIYAPNTTIDLGAFSFGNSVVDTGTIVANSLNFSLSIQLQLNVQ